MTGREFEYQQLPLRELEIAEDNVRRNERTADLDELADSLDTLGLQQPIVVQRKGDKYEVVIGQRRFLAAKRLRWEHIDAKVLSEPLDELHAKIVSFSENAQRRDLTPRDKSDVCRYLLERLGSIRAVAKQLGVSEQTVRKWVGYAGVPEAMKALVAEGKLSPAIATRIATNIDNEATAMQVAERIAKHQPPAADRTRILDAVEDYPDRSADFIFEKAQERRNQQQITFVLPLTYEDMMAKAARELNRDASEIAREATVEWLDRFMALLIPTSDHRGA